jgi:thiol:disulfide interchange protein
VPSALSLINMRTVKTILASALASFIIASGSPARAAQPDVYPPPEQASADIAAALKSAAAAHKRVILDFGGNWCTDCHVLDLYFHDAANSPLLAANYILVHVNIGHRDANVDIAARYQVPLTKGVPAIAVLDAKGKLLYSQKGGEFEAMRRMQTGAVTDFLVRWKGPVAATRNTQTGS